MSKKKWYIYIVECCDKTFYTGITTDLERRLNEHNCSDGKGARYTRTRRPVKLIYNEAVSSMGKAIKREIAIKKMGRKGKEKLIKS